LANIHARVNQKIRAVAEPPEIGINVFGQSFLK